MNEVSLTYCDEIDQRVEVKMTFGIVKNLDSLFINYRSFLAQEVN